MENIKSNRSNGIIYLLSAVIILVVIVSIIFFIEYQNTNTKLSVDRIEISNYQSQVSGLQKQLINETSDVSSEQNQVISIQSNIQKADKYIAVLNSWFSNDTYSETMNVVNSVNDSTMTYDIQAVIGADATWEDSEDNYSALETLMNADTTFEQYVCDTINNILNPINN